MSPEQKALVRSTWQRVVPIADQAAALFYDRLFEIAPEVRPLFEQVDPAQQRAKLVQTLAAAVSALDRLDGLLPTLEALGRRHAGYSVKAAHFDSVGAALLWTLEQGLGTAWSDEARQAWAAAYGLIAGVMRDAMAEAYAQRAAQANRKVA